MRISSKDVQRALSWIKLMEFYADSSFAHELGTLEDRRKLRHLARLVRVWFLTVKKASGKERGVRLRAIAVAYGRSKKIYRSLYETKPLGNN